MPRLPEKVRLHHPVADIPVVWSLTDREKSVLSLLRRTGPLTRSSLIRESGLSGPAIFRVTEELAAAGLLMIGETVVEGRGQPSNRVALQGDAAFSIGLSVMSDYAEAVLMDLGGTVRAVAQVTAPGMTQAGIYANLTGFMDDLVARGMLPRKRLVGIGIAVAGYFIGDGDKVNPSPELEDWALVDLAAPAAARFGVSVQAENIASAAAVGEALLGVGRRIHDFVYVNVASGFGGGLILDGRLRRGRFGNAGELGGILSNAGLPIPTLESLRQHLIGHGVPLAGITELVEGFDPGWPGLDGWVEQAAASLHVLAKMAGHVLDVQAIVLGGRLPPALSGRLAERAGFDHAVLDAAARRGRAMPLPQILPAEVSSRAAAVGAATLPLASTFFSLLPVSG